MDPAELAKWRKAYPDIFVTDAGLATVAPFPSLYATDFAVYLEAKGVNAEIVRFLLDLTREAAWAYGGWQKAQHDGNPASLINDLLNNASSVGDADYSFVKRFLVDYAHANGIALAQETAGQPSWMLALGGSPAVEATPMVEVVDPLVVAKVAQPAAVVPDEAVPDA